MWMRAVRTLSENAPALVPLLDDLVAKAAAEQ
jgi:hypothetical protein